MKLKLPNKKDIKWKDLPVFLIFVVLASGFWLLQQVKENNAASARNVYAQDQEVLTDSLSRERKKIPVRWEGVLSPATGYRWTDSLHIEPASVWVYGNAKQLDTLQCIKTVELNEENIRKNVDLTLKLDVPKGLRASVQKVRLTAGVEEYTEKKFELPVVCRNLPEDVQLRFFPSSVEMTCYLSLNYYSQLNREDLEIGVDYNELIQHTGINTAVLIFRKPQWLVDYRITPETVEYLIEQKREL